MSLQWPHTEPCTCGAVPVAERLGLAVVSTPGVCTLCLPWIVRHCGISGCSYPDRASAVESWNERICHVAGRMAPTPAALASGLWRAP